MQHEIFFKSKIDGKSEFGYISFSVIAIMLAFILVYLLKGDAIPFLQAYFFHFMLFFIVVAIGLILVLFPKKKVYFKKKGALFFVKIEQPKEEAEFLRITGFDYWWNYNFGNNAYSSIGWNGGGNSGLSGRGTENCLNLHVVLYGKTGVVQNLTENLEMWQSFPMGWKYDLAYHKDTLIVSNLKKLVNALKENGLPYGNSIILPR